MPNPDYTHIQVLLDRSGSMSQIREDMEGGFNTFLSEQQEQPGKATIGLNQFDDTFESVYEMRPILDADPLNLVPRGSTALIDALAISIDKLGNRLRTLADPKRPGHVIFVIITDGYENASRKHTRADVFNRITTQRNQYGWDFVYLGANQDAIAEAKSYGIPMAGTLDWQPTGQSVGSTYSTLSSNVSSTRSAGTRTNITQADRDAAK